MGTKKIGSYNTFTQEKSWLIKYIQIENDNKSEYFYKYHYFYNPGLKKDFLNTKGRNYEQKHFITLKKKLSDQPNNINKSKHNNKLQHVTTN